MANPDLSKKISEYNASVLMRIRQMCIERGTSITKIEKALGYGNGTVSGWKNAKKKAPYDRIVAIAEFLDVPVSQLTGDEPKFDIQLFAEKNPALENENGITDVQKMAIDFIKTLSDEQLKRYITMGKAAFGGDEQ